MAKGRKRTKGIPEIHDELKTRVTLSLTPKAVEGLDSLAKELLMSRSELVERIGRGIIPLAHRTSDKSTLGNAIEPPYGAEQSKQPRIAIIGLDPPPYAVQESQDREPTIPIHVPLSTILNALAPGGIAALEITEPLIDHVMPENAVAGSAESNNSHIAEESTIKANNRHAGEKRHFVIQKSEQDFWLIGRDGREYEITLALSDENVLKELPDEIQKALRILLALAGGSLAVNE